MYLPLSLPACPCGRAHTVAVDEVIIGKGALSRLPEVAARYNATRVFLLADKHTYAAAGERARTILESAGYPTSAYIFPQEALEPDEFAVGSAIMHFDHRCDLIVAVGSGVLNDIGKILSKTSGRKYVIVGTAPSMDGYASATSSMSLDGLKVSLPSRCADVIIGDTDILKEAPLHTLKAGLGDMLAKYVSLAEWRIAHLITGEYYCQTVAQLVRDAVKKCVDNAQGLLAREEAAVEAVFEGLVIGGVAMAFAGVSRPASGVEHYFSHVWDMRGLEFGTPVDLHGIQCAMGTYAAARLYDAVRTMTPDAGKAAAYVAAFDTDAWFAQLRTFLGKGADTMIAQEAREGKYVKSTHPARYAIIADHWTDILRILEEELPSAEAIGQILDAIAIPRDLNAIGVDRSCARLTFQATKDIRDKYVLSRLAWDLGILDELAELL